MHILIEDPNISQKDAELKTAHLIFYTHENDLMGNPKSKEFKGQLSQARQFCARENIKILFNQLNEEVCKLKSICEGDINSEDTQRIEVLLSNLSPDWISIEGDLL